jgi:hypothetical protein
MRLGSPRGPACSATLPMCLSCARPKGLGHRQGQGRVFGHSRAGVRDRRCSAACRPPDGGSGGRDGVCLAARARRRAGRRGWLGGARASRGRRRPGPGRPEPGQSRGEGGRRCPGLTVSGAALAGGACSRSVFGAPRVAVPPRAARPRAVRYRAAPRPLGAAAARAGSAARDRTWVCRCACGRQDSGGRVGCLMAELQRPRGRVAFAGGHDRQQWSSGARSGLGAGAE